MGVDAVEVSVGVDEPGRGLLAHAGNAGEVVRGVASQRRVLRVTGRSHPGARLDPGFVVEDVVRYPPAVVEHLDVGILDQLVGVSISRDDDDVVAPSGGLGRQGGDHVVRFKAGQVHHRDAQRLDELAHQAHLLAKDVGRR